MIRSFVILTPRNFIHKYILLIMFSYDYQKYSPFAKIAPSLYPFRCYSIKFNPFSKSSSFANRNFEFPIVIFLVGIKICIPNLLKLKLSR